MSYRGYAVLIAVMMGITGVAMMLIAWLPPEITSAPGQVIGGVMVVASLVGLGMGFMMPNAVRCPQCGGRGNLHIDFWTGRPELQRTDTGHTGAGQDPTRGTNMGPGGTGSGPWRQG